MLLLQDSIGGLESNVILKDGASVHIRLIRPADDQTLVKIFNQSSLQTIYQRFFSALPELSSSVAHHLANVDYRHRLALIAETDTEPIGVVRYESTHAPNLAELGISIVDHWQDRGLGRILLRAILRAGERNGIRQFWAEVLAENRRMLHLLATECQIQKSRTEGSVTTVFFTLDVAAKSKTTLPDKF